MQKPPRYGRKAKQVSELLAPGKSGMGKLLARAREIERLDRKLSTLLDSSMASSVQVATVRDQCLVLITPSAALATRLRLDARQLLHTLRSSGEKSIREIRVRVVPTDRDPMPISRRRELPEIAKRSLERFATDSGDEDIKAIIRRKSTQIIDE